MVSPLALEPINSDWLLCESRDAKSVSQTFLRVVDVVVVDRRVRRHSVIPQCNGAFLPPNTGLEVLTLCDMLLIVRA